MRRIRSFIYKPIYLITALILPGVSLFYTPSMLLLHQAIQMIGTQWATRNFLLAQHTLLN